MSLVGRAARRGSWLALACALAPAAIPAPTAPDTTSDSRGLDALLQQFAARRASHVTFTEVHQLALLDRPLQSSGELLYQAPDRLEKRTLKPRAETLVLEHGVLSAQRGRHTYQMALRDYPQVVPFIESIRATLAGDRATLERLFHVDFDGTVDNWTLHLVPSDETLAGVVTDIRIAGTRDAIRTVEIREHNGDRSLLTLGAVSP